MSNSSNSRYSIALCELHNKRLHGMTQDSSPDIQNHYLASFVFDNEEFYDNEWKGLIANMRTAYSQRRNIKHDSIRNYKNIVNDPNYFNLDIVELTELEGGELIATKKTHLLKIIQRKWRKIHHERKRILQGRKTPRALEERRITGQWPKHLRQWPIIYKVKQA